MKVLWPIVLVSVVFTTESVHPQQKRVHHSSDLHFGHCRSHRRGHTVVATIINQSKGSTRRYSLLGFRVSRETRVIYGKCSVDVKTGIIEERLQVRLPRRGETLNAGVQFPFHFSTLPWLEEEFVPYQWRRVLGDRLRSVCRYGLTYRTLTRGEGTSPSSAPGCLSVVLIQNLFSKLDGYPWFRGNRR